MIEASRVAAAEWIFSWYIRRLARRHFQSIHLVGGRPEADPTIPLVLTPNHGTWWDGFFVYLFNRTILHRTLHLMMLDEQLARYRFFSKVGAFGITPGNRREVMMSLRYSASCLQEAENMLCIFPQGELLYANRRPLEFKEGLAWILKRHGGPVNLVPLAVRAVLLAEQRPQVFFRAETHRVSGDDFPGIRWLENRVTSLLDGIEEDLRRGEHGELILRGTRSVSDTWTALKRRLDGGRGS